jgi:hypothetical protein
LQEFAPGAEIHSEKVAVRPEQIAVWNLPTRPIKASDSRSVTWQGGDSVEFDAICPDLLRDLVREVVEQHVDAQKLEALKVAEESERDLLRSWRPNGQGTLA